jgi:hypothetical protein
MVFFFNSFVYGKAAGHLIRISAAVHVFHNAFQLMLNYNQEVDIMDKEYLDYLKTSEYSKVIDFPIISTAFAVTHYFIQQKLILAGFVKQDADIVKHDDGSNSVIKPVPVDSLERKILLYPGANVFLSTLSGKHICQKMEFQQAAKKLQSLKLGSLNSQFKNASSKRSQCFIKINPNSIGSSVDSVELINNLMNFFVTVQDYEIAFNESEN